MISQGKNKALADAGAIVPDSFEAFEGAIGKTFKKLMEGGLTPAADVTAPTLPLDLEVAKKAGKVPLSTPLLDVLLRCGRMYSPCLAGLPVPSLYHHHS